MSFGARMRAIRVAHELALEDVGLALRVSPELVRLVEVGRRPPLSRPRIDRFIDLLLRRRKVVVASRAILAEQKGILHEIGAELRAQAKLEIVSAAVVKWETGR